MTLEDPFFVVKDEVCKALNKTRGLYRRWLELQDDTTNNVSKDELEWTTTELRNALRSIEWDLEDLEDTIGIVEKNPSKFKIDNKELSSRRSFIDQTRDEVKTMKDKMNISRGRDRDRTARQPLLENSPVRVPTSHGTTKYSKLENELDSPNRQFLDDTLQQQNHIVRTQDEQLDMISDSIGTLKTVSRQIGSELDEQAVMLDEFGNELENTDSKLDTTMKKVAKVLHMSNELPCVQSSNGLPALAFEYMTSSQWANLTAHPFCFQTLTTRLKKQLPKAVDCYCSFIRNNGSCHYSFHRDLKRYPPVIVGCRMSMTCE